LTDFKYKRSAAGGRFLFLFFLNNGLIQPVNRLSLNRCEKSSDFSQHRSRRVVSACADLNAPLIFRRIQRRPAFRRWTTSGEAAGGRFLF